MELSFRIDKSELPHVDKIVERALGLYRSAGVKRDRMGLRMDVTVTHANGCPLRLAELAEADDFNLMHDVNGINLHLDRTTGQLLNHFRPRYARKD